MKVPLLPRGRAAAFTLAEVLVVITIIAALFALVMGAFSYAQNASKRNTTKITLSVVQSALGSYQKEMGELPEPANVGDTIEIVGKTYEVAGAAMLYQALSGDGNDQILTGGTEASRSSNGFLDDEEVKEVVLKEMPKTMWMNLDGKYFIADGWGRPFQYVKAVDVDPTDPTAAQAATTINNSYDVWSYGDDVDNTTARSIDILTNTELKTDSLRWIGNW